MSTKEEILKAAYHLFASFGYHKTTMEQIAKEAGVAKGTLYWHFPGKKELFLGIINDEMKKWFDFLEKLKLNDEMTVVEKVEAMIEYKVGFFLKHQSVVREAMHDRESINKSFKDEMVKLRQQNMSLIAAIFEQGIKEGIFDIDDPYIAAQVFLGMNISVSNPFDLLKEERKRIIIKTLKKIFLTGILKDSCRDDEINVR